MSYQGRVQSAREAILQTVAYFDAIDYAPTWTECASWFEWSGAHGFEYDAPPTVPELVSARDGLVHDGRLESGFGRIALHGRLARLALLAMERTALFPRKVRRARSVARWLLRNPNVRYVALANTTALAHARDLGDLDFFVVVRAGTIWSSRLLGSGVYKLLGRLPGHTDKQDAVCLSYFVADDALDLSSHMLPGDDPYFRYWFLSLLPLADDGVGKSLWDANRALISRHPRAERWMLTPDLTVTRPRIRCIASDAIESLARRFQLGWFPKQIVERMNRDTSVMVNDHVLKFHVDDGREAYRAAYQERLRVMGLV
ncbi:hypothetical protein A3E39_00630 [Candidatus Uhrbacteria bacterium RIFCSPHIGHO2_12_FULL_60_25]|uniref:Nucleotidyltransferase n=1 Tax=Candidatus Uhrbacteria bacterium RIFCSPHIGHO2_12_FULL_60_25 TaxID=1802399 RepID=A0A1F7UN03_9BACT|nr:MAG: hypothetical protein A3D73_01700 [Candidatus Uhrbacteria bacterium RIFCSPHIGHO2_02_FULL_60_44]OGL79615.1 MAG: hypothetical protein A3E39_00630 [Candidatus Uhrbacteria bacterium RIFCSPHIGHO2_12_FULL_60_25]